ncbi:MAG: ABC transporter substrate-binding protein [Gordonia sp. (in: high G+C Gram-positive bacteria)]|uniref:ABC transporter substrate-binding protein n=1 Tax=Gordonia sp. (in: high G+C Gram-positive bacteria) TaxID=84139 RepID=UPI0039E2601D
MRNSAVQRRIGRIGISLAAATAVMVAGAACSSTDDAGGSTKLDQNTTLIVGDQVKGTQSLLEAAGELKDVPYKIEWASFEAGPPLLEAEAAGKVDIGGTGAPPAVFAQAANSPIKIVGVETYPKVNDYLLVAPDSPIKTVADLKGKKVAFTKGSSSNGLVLALLKQAGLKPSDIQETYLNPTEGLSAFQSGQVDALAVWSPYAVLAKQKGARVVGDGTGLVTQQVYFLASDKALGDTAKSAALKDFVGRLGRAQKWAKGHEDDWVPVYSKLTTLPEPVARETFEGTAGELTLIDDKSIGQQQGLIDLFADAGVIPTKPVAKDFFDDRFNSEISGS